MQEEPKLSNRLYRKGMASLTSDTAVLSVASDRAQGIALAPDGSERSAVPVWSFGQWSSVTRTGIELWSPSVGWNPQFTDKDRTFCAALWAHGKQRGLSNDEAEAMALMRTWSARGMRNGSHLCYSPAQERRMAALFIPKEAS